MHIKTLEAMNRFGMLLGRHAQSGQVLCLDGDLGAGKTTLTQAIARGLGIPEDCYVTSPSFAIMHEYTGGRLPMYHMDFYRLHDSSEIIDLGFEEYFYGSGLSVIEWSERAADILPDDCLRIYISVDNLNGRKLKITGGEVFEHLFSDLSNFSQ